MSHYAIKPQFRNFYDEVAPIMRVFDVHSEGSLVNRWLLATATKDGLLSGTPRDKRRDTEGEARLSAPGGVWEHDRLGNQIGKVPIPEYPTYAQWVGHDSSSITAPTSVCAAERMHGPRNEPLVLMGRATGSSRSVPSSSTHQSDRASLLDPLRCALIIQDMQNDVVMEGGAFADSGSPQHCRDQNAIENARRLAEHCRRIGVPVIHVWFVVVNDGRGMTQNAPLFVGAMAANALRKGTWGAQPVPGLEPAPGDHVVTKMRMSAWEGTNLETILKAEGRDTILEVGAWTNMSIEHTARTGADKGYIMIIPEDACSTMNADWHKASIDYALQNVATVTTTDEAISALGGDRNSP